MTFCEATSASAVAASAFSSSIVDLGSGSALFGGGAVGVSSDARIREIGGSTVVFFLTSPSAIFFCGCFLSISETLSTGVRGVAAAFGCGFAVAAGCAVVFVGAWACAGFACDFTGSFVTLPFAAVGLWCAAAGLRTAVFFPAGFDFVAI